MASARGILSWAGLDTILQMETSALNSNGQGLLRDWCLLRLQVDERQLGLAVSLTGDLRKAVVLLAFLRGEIGRASETVIHSEFLNHRKMALKQIPPEPEAGFTTDELEFAAATGHTAAVERIIRTNRLIFRQWRDVRLLGQSRPLEDFLRVISQSKIGWAGCNDDFWKVAMEVLRLQYGRDSATGKGAVGAMGGVGPIGIPEQQRGYRVELVVNRDCRCTLRWRGVITDPEVIQTQLDLDHAPCDHLLFDITAGGCALVLLAYPIVINRILLPERFRSRENSPEKC